MSSYPQQHCENQLTHFSKDFQQSYDQNFEKNSQNNLQQSMAPSITVHEVISSTSIEENNNFHNSKQKHVKQSISQQHYNQKSQHSQTSERQKPHQQQTQSVNMSNTSINGQTQIPQFQVVVHKVSSKQSLHENDDQFQIQFTKSQLQIPIDVDEESNQPIKQETEYVNIWKKDQSQDDDFYVKFLQEKWARKESEVICPQKPQNQEKQPQSFGIVNIFKQLSKITNQTNLTPKKQEPLKKAIFKIKKLKQQNNRSSCSTLNVKSIKSPKQLNRVSSNKSQFINIKKQKSSVQLNRFSKKNLSNFQSAKNSPTKPKLSTKKSDQNIQYEFVVGNKLERMNQILQDRSYNTILSSINKQNYSISNLQQQKVQQHKISQMPIKTVRKVIKRSPYGILQIEVKDSKNHAKITNLRILKPKQMIKLKKIPRIVKNFKQNICE